MAVCRIIIGGSFAEETSRLEHDGFFINEFRCLYLKLVHRLNIRASIAIPAEANSVDFLEEKRNIGHYGEQVMRRLRKLARPDEFVSSMASCFLRFHQACVSILRKFTNE